MGGNKAGEADAVEALNGCAVTVPLDHGVAEGRAVFLNEEEGVRPM